MSQFILAAQAAQGGGMSFILMMVAIFAIMYFFMIRPQQKRQKEIQNFQNSLAEGTSRTRWPRVQRSSPAAASTAPSRRLTWQRASSR